LLYNNKLRYMTSSNTYVYSSYFRLIVKSKVDPSHDCRSGSG
jgi:hypothetical protein